VAARSVKVFALPLGVIAVGWGRQGALWLLHLSAARGGLSQLRLFGFTSRVEMSA